MTKVIDISSWQDASTPDIDFAKVKESGVVGVMIKFTQGIGYTNPKARINMDKAREAGLLVGAYHVGEIDKNTPEAEAEFFLRSIDGQALDLATALDLENFGRATFPAPGNWVEKWHELVKDRAPNDLIYLNESLYNSLGGTPAGFKLWAAQFTPADAAHTFMVQDPATTVPGINGAVDVSHLVAFRAVNAADPTATTTKANALRLPVLSEGAHGLAVKVLQTLLRAHGHNVTVDGAFGPKTAAAVRDFQTFENLRADGIVGPKTLAALAPDYTVSVPLATAHTGDPENLAGTGLNAQDVVDLQAQVDGLNAVADQLSPANNGIDQAIADALARGETPPVRP